MCKFTFQCAFFQGEVLFRQTIPFRRVVRLRNRSLPQGTAFLGRCCFCKENFFSARHLSLRRCFCLWRRSLPPACFSVRFSSRLLCFIAPSVDEKRVFIPSGRRRIVEESSRDSLFCRAARSFHGIFCPLRLRILSVALFDARRADAPFRRAVLRSIPPFFHPIRRKSVVYARLKKFGARTSNFFDDRRALQGVVLNLSKAKFYKK